MDLVSKGYQKFQFHYGTIKSIKHSHIVIIRHRFNSTMVRLKELNNTSVHKLSGFQFHYGTIKRVSSDGKNEP